VLTCARSGSTLLRYVLDAHHEVVCPPELNLSQLMAEVERAWSMVDDPPTRQGRNELGTREARRAAETAMGWWLDHTRKICFCDKSLSTVDQADVVHRAFPAARFLVLFRHPLDVVVSGLEASRWGFNAFGFAPYAQAAPQNHVAAILEYWCDRVERALDFERRHPDRCYRIYYEMMVRDPEETLSGVFGFLGLDWSRDILRRAFDGVRPHGPADYEVDFTGSVTARSIGCGSSVPLGQIPLPQRTRLNLLLAQLGYPVVGEDWNRAPSPLLVERPDGTADGKVARLFQERVARRAARLAAETGRRHKPSLRVVIETSPVRETWVVDLCRGEVIRGDAAASAQVVMTGSLLGRIVSGDWSAGEALHAGELRMDVRSKEHTERDVVELVSELLGPDGVGGDEPRLLNGADTSARLKVESANAG
jgi:protein-tyrosine sulfotransferase